MDIKELLPKDTEGRLRIIQETVPGRQITLAHVITSPKPIVYRKLGLNPDIDFDRSAIGIITVTPSESAVIGADIAMNEMEAVFFFRDPLTAQPHEPDISALIRLADVHKIPIATNQSTAELLVTALKLK